MRYLRSGLFITLLLMMLAACNGPVAAPAPTPAPTPTLRPGFKLFEGTGVALQLPDTFTGGKLTGEDFKLLLERLKTLGSDFDQTVKLLESNPDLYLLWAFDSNVGKSGFMTNVNVTTEKVMSFVSIDTYVDAVLKQLPAQFKVQSRDSVTIAGQPAGQLISEIAAFNSKQLMYILKYDNRIYAVTYSTGLNDFDGRRPQFEQSIQTFVERP
jgi:hypothetical protein